MQTTIKDLKNLLNKVNMISNPFHIKLLNGNLSNLNRITNLFSNENENLIIEIKQPPAYEKTNSIDFYICDRRIALMEFTPKSILIHLEDNYSANVMIFDKSLSENYNPIEEFNKYLVKAIKSLYNFDYYATSEMKENMEKICQLIIADNLILAFQLYEIISNELKSIINEQIKHYRKS